jgi:glutamyl-tRNA reductase
MRLLTFGINHTTATITLREKVAFATDQMAEALTDACRSADLAEAAILSTCNRTELIGVAEDDEPRQQLLQRWLAEYHNLCPHELADHCYSHEEADAMRHMMQVASGLDSMVLGEPQIFGQMKSAFAVAKEAGTVSGGLTAAFHQAFNIAKKVRTDTAVGENPVSVAYAAVRLASHIFSDLSEAHALLVGAGETIELVARHLAEAGVGKIVVANRTLESASQLAQRFNAEAALLPEIPDRLVDADIVITSTASQLPLLGKGAVEHAIKSRKHRPILMVDIAVPRDIEEQVGELPDVYLYTVDDLKDIINENKRARENEARKADLIIEQGVVDYLVQRRSLNALSTLKAFRSKGEELRDAELEKALRQLSGGGDPGQVMEALARNLTNKLMHAPSVAMKQAGAEDREDLLAWAHNLFDLDPADFDKSDDQ